MTEDLNACELLDADHIAVKHLFVAYAQLATGPAAPGNADERRALALKICAELKQHTQLEETLFYPEVRKAVPEANALLDEAEQEHDEAKGLIAKIEGMGEADAALDDTVAELARAIEHHVKEERDELFPMVKGAGTLDLDALGQQMRDAVAAPA